MFNPAVQENCSLLIPAKVSGAGAGSLPTTILCRVPTKRPFNCMASLVHSMDTFQGFKCSYHFLISVAADTQARKIVSGHLPSSPPPSGVSLNSSPQLEWRRWKFHRHVVQLIGQEVRLTPASPSGGSPSETRTENKTEDVRESVALSAACLHLSCMGHPRTHALHLPRHPPLG